MNKVILSSPMILEEGSFSVRKITKREALNWLDSTVKNYCGHETTKVLGVEPEKTRKTCTGYDQALCISPNKRLEFGREYTSKEIERIGVTYWLLRKL